MKEHEFKTRCPYCDHKHELASNLLSSGGPRDGDLTMCFRCGQWMIFASRKRGGLRKPTAAERNEIASDERLRDIERAWRDVVAQ